MNVERGKTTQVTGQKKKKASRYQPQSTRSQNYSNQKTEQKT